ncbi:hypothetical protein [Phyllobacterium endophyticum]|uniref:hypothetical protein n=1 Tax=Phyllobacterium endophyticum TaxID=1149773 RepID=UPI0011CB0170|nr:hypothetical protein [Phyllobacterium endophyticum]TXR47925.1 hypothetical protein FVA77_17960 [Phyllobacterium endophyticum]
MAGSADNSLFRFTLLRAAKSEFRQPAPGRSLVDSASTVHVPALRSATARPSAIVNPPLFNPLRESRDLVSAQREFERLDPIRDLNLSVARGMFTLQASAIKRLSSRTKSTLEKLGVSLADTHIGELVAAINGALTPSQPEETPGEPPAPSPGPAQLSAVGVADLLVVKQQIKRYEAGEIAHIENILDGESKLRTHRQLNRTEEVISTLKEQEHEKETELQTTERFELNRETTRTQQADQKVGFGLSLSGKYGPTVEFESKFDVSNQTSEENGLKNSVTYAKDVVERSKERIVERVREERRLTILREVEEVNEHRLTNDSGEHSAGIYQFVDKIYESQVFNYGLRQMFDFMIPEPASYMWHLEKMPQPDPELPIPPIRLEVEAPDANHIHEGNYLRLGARYGTKGLRAPPPIFLVRSASVTQGLGNDSEEDQPRSRNQIEIQIPKGYRPVWALTTVMGVTDEDPHFAFSLGNEYDYWRPTAQDERIDVQEGALRFYRPNANRVTVFPSDGGLYADDDKLTIHIFAHETANYSVHTKVTFQRQAEGLREWSTSTYDTIAEAYSNVLLRYQQEVETLKQKKEAEKGLAFEFGNPPSVNERIIRTELKKHCLAFIRNEHAGLLNTAHTGGGSLYPPHFDIEDAKADGAIIRFFEHAFEWDQIQYVFYPYFWARPGGWADRFRARNMDAELEEFLKAGYARVVVPVRVGFEAAVSYFMQEGHVWNDEGEPPIDHPLYKPIVDEIKERTGGDRGEVPVGEPWETHLPTTAVLVRKGHTLPEWERLSPNEWKWKPKV